MEIKFNTTILVAPLDWGLGHSVRCIPIIRHLQLLGCKVIIAAEGAQEKLLKQEFPFLEFVHLPGYRIQYSGRKQFFALKILLQLPKIYRAIKNEKKWLNNFITQRSVDAVISDNRYGLFHAEVKCVFITHQLTVKAPFTFAEKLIQKLNYKFISKFSACWIPDEEGNLNLAGKLSHPKKLPLIPVSYLGSLSRFDKKEVSIKYDLLIVLSGPEPQRTVLENKVLTELTDFKGKTLLVRGLPGNAEDLPSFKQLTIKNHLSATEMETAFNESEFIISRTGYTTVMDICKLQKKAILIPTPGQTEQEYLAKHLYKQGWCLTVSQQEFSLNEALSKAHAFPFAIPAFDMNQYKKIIEQLGAS